MRKTIGQRCCLAAAWVALTGAYTAPYTGTAAQTAGPGPTLSCSRWVFCPSIFAASVSCVASPSLPANAMQITSFSTEDVAIFLCGAAVAAIAAVVALCLSWSSVSRIRRALDGPCGRLHPVPGSGLSAPLISAETATATRVFADSRGPEAAADEFCAQDSVHPAPHIAIPSRLLHILLTMSGLWWAGLPGHRPLYPILTSLPSIMFFGWILLFAVYWASRNGGLQKSDLHDIATSVAYILSSIISRLHFSNIGWVVYRPVAGLSARGLASLRSVSALFVVLTVVYSAAYAVQSASDFSTIALRGIHLAWPVYVISLVLYFLVFTSIFVTTVPLCIFGHICAVKGFALLEMIFDITAAAADYGPAHSSGPTRPDTGAERAAGVPTADDVVSEYCNIKRLMRASAVHLSLVVLPLVVLVAYFVIALAVNLSSQISMLSFVLDVLVIFLSLAIVLLALTPAARASSKMEDVRALLAMAGVGAVKTGDRALYLGCPAPSVTCQAAAGLAADVRTAMAGLFGDVGLGDSRTRPVSAGSAGVDKHSKAVLMELLHAIASGGRNAFPLFSVDITFALMGRCVSVVVTAVIFLVQLRLQSGA